jgi:hypothetical protein
VRFDVLDTQAIWLKLPDRSSIVEDLKFHALLDEAKRAMYEYLATLPSHCAPFKLYLEALQLGVELPEASPWFAAFKVDTHECDYNSTVLAVQSKLTLVDLESTAIVKCMADEDTESYYAFTFGIAARYFKTLAVSALQDDGARYKGYSWYPNVRRLDSFSLLIDGVAANGITPVTDLTVVDTITLSFSLTGQKSPITWDLPFACRFDEDTESLRMYVTKASPWVIRKDEPFDLVEAAMHVGFSFNDSNSGDSYDTQKDEYREEYETEFITVLGGKTAVIREEIAKALQSWPLSHLLKTEGIGQVLLNLKQDGYGWDITLTKAA